MAKGEPRAGPGTAPKVARKAKGGCPAMSVKDSFATCLGPVHVAGRGLVTPKGWISPETRALMQKAQDDCAAAQAANSTAPRDAQRVLDDATPGFVTDPFGGQR